MASATQSPGGDDLSTTTLHVYLKDPTFVEYFNAFLLLPAFSSRLFFNGKTGFFEQVHGDGVQAWSAAEENITPTSSLATLYLTDDVVGPSVDKQQSWDWVTEHRLPLFLRSDLYSEYKLCKLLTEHSTDHSNSDGGGGGGGSTTSESAGGEALKSHKTNSSTRLPMNTKDIGKKPHPLSKSSSSIATVCLPSLTGQNTDEPCTGSNSPSMGGSGRHNNITTSKSDIELGSKGGEGNATSLQHQVITQRQLQRQVNVSTDVSCITLEEGVLEQQQQQERAGKRASVKSSPRMTDEDLAFLSTKSGMSALWKFLRGTMGERNWLFWLDAEHVKYYTKPIDQRRLLREISEKYLHSGSPLELPAETRNKLRVNKASRLTIAQLKELQLFMVQGLREYWCPRFILHCRSEEDILSQHPQLPSLSHFHSASPSALHHNHSVPGDSACSLTPNYPRKATPFTPSRTPTFKRLSSSHHRSKSSPMYRKAQGDNTPTSLRNSAKSRQLAAGTDDAGAARYHENLHHHPTTSAASGGGRLPGGRATQTGSGKAHSRKVWDQRPTTAESMTSAGGSPKDRTTSKKISSAKNNYQQAKYTLQHLLDPNSRCASSMDYPERGGMCESRCQILSVSGTPLHSVTGSPGHYPSYSSEAYSSLLHCLNAERRKAGGHLQNHLETLKNKTFLNCLLFWFDVQKYKALFVGSSFSPCAVEMKAKALYSSYVSEGCDTNIDSPIQLSSIVASNLWPAYEDLFDSVEEHALAMLLIPWMELCSAEDRTFQELEVLSRPASFPCLIGLEGLDEEGGICENDDASLQFRSRSVSVAFASGHTLHADASGSLRGSSSRLGGIPKATSLNDMMQNRVEFEHFKIFLNEHLAAQDLMCWMEIEAFRGIPMSEKTIRDIKAKQLRTTYFNKKYFFGPTSPATKEQQRQTVQAGGGSYGCRLPARPRTPVFREAQKHVRRRLEKKWLAEFITTPEFIARNGGSLLKDTLRGRRASTNAQSQSFFFERSFANSHEAILFRRALQDKVQRHLLQRYLVIKQMSHSASLMSFSRQNIEFWLEVQRYKEMCHVHTTDSMLQNKITAIIDNYFQSSTPPRLQLNVPMNVAEEITSKPHGPYVFRVAQAAVFKYLFSCWEEYKNFTSGYYTPEEVERALDQLQQQMTTSIATEREQESKLRREQEQMRLAMPRFETEAEKTERIRMEQELAEFGEVSVAFRLSKPNPRYTYYTDLPEDFYTEEMRMLRQKAANGISRLNSLRRRHSTGEQAHVPHAHVESRRTKVNTYSPHYLQRKQAKLPKEDNSEPPVIMMKLERGHKMLKDSKTGEPTTVSFEDEVNSKMPLKSESSHQQLLLERQTSRSLFHLKRANSRLMTFRRSTTTKKIHDSRFAPHTTINMRLSDGPQTFELYGEGLPREQTSHLRILNVTTS